ncbi:MAG: VCBS repeat-containing protein, partial [Deltaproteobacteria bacterium]
VEWAPGIEPLDSAFQTLAHQTGVTTPTTGTLATLDLTSVHVDNPGEPENRYTITLRVRAIAHYGATSSVMDVPGESRRAFSVVRDPDLMPGYPLDVRASGEASPHLADMDEDGHPEVVFPTASGLVHAIRANGTEAPGFPVHTDPAWGYGHRAGEPDYTTAPAYTGAARALDPASTYEAVSTAAGIADLDGDGHLEVVVAGWQGGIYVFRHDGTPWGHGFPVRLPAVPSAMTSPDAVLDRGVHASPVLADLDGDTHPEIIVGGFDGWLHVFDAATGAPHAGFPVELHNTASPTRRARVFGGITVGRFDTDSIPDLLVTTNEQLLATRNTGVMFLVHGDGTRHAGGPMHPHWPVVVDSTDVLPDLGEGLSNALAAADFDNDHIDDIAIVPNGQPGLSLNRTPLDHDVPQPVPLASLGQIHAIRTSGRGLRSDAQAPGPFTSTLSSGAIGDINADGVPDFAVLGATLSTLNAIGDTGRVVYEHQLGAWDGRTGTWISGFPRHVEDFGFLSGPVIADVSGDGYPEVAIGTGGFLHHAADGCGREAPGFPKTTGQWNMAVPAIGDIDGDGRVEYAANTRNGWLFVWHTQGVAGGAHPWPTWRHDNANTGNYGSPLAAGVRQVPGIAPLVCPSTMPLDGGVSDASTDDAARDGGADADAGPRIAAGGGCGCRAQGAPRGRGAMLVFAAMAAVLSRRRRSVRSSRRAPVHPEFSARLGGPLTR